MILGSGTELWTLIMVRFMADLGCGRDDVALMFGIGTMCAALAFLAPWMFIIVGAAIVVGSLAAD